MKLYSSMSDAGFKVAETGSDILLDGMFATQAVSVALDDLARLRTMMSFEVALAEAEATLGIIPVTAAKHIASCARPEQMDVSALAAAAARAGNIAIPFVAAFTSLIAKDNPEAARYVHWGATSQDVIDTATILQLQEAIMAIKIDLLRLEQTLAGITEDHVETVLPGRTWLQHAVPTTFGLKAAGWLTAVTQARRHLETAVARASYIQFGGAVGTLASLDGRGVEVAAELARRLNLNVPPLPWHTLRGDLAACGSALGILCGALGKLARDLSLMMQTEIAEILPPGGKEQGGSSTMPHKRNPVGCAIALSAATQAPGLVATMLSAMVQAHERGLGGWHAEWQTLPTLLRLTSASAAHMADTVETMEIRPDAMRDDLGKTHGLMMAEAISMALAERLGRETAHHLLQELTKKAVRRNVPLDAVLQEDDRVTTILSTDDINRLMDPSGYLGNARNFCIRSVEAWRNGENKKCS
ncbi:3-carboxy-cis,cis-muconate cycloisomerase [Acetobacter senegalensis]|uniref:3-carboxy-cis,cis-muconate cycloisomerase n=1 Tax=Acetobacter senegalensis TaxID=446692 RepID=UPI0020A0561B|nr:3-carboxy-cis,cis-muconate cycloisomerase [Acetobacter senegalensis]MCP1196039.1 3-carboxy-cis,cis-muconate cycloisomerase [Acetobacter senegalensis]